MNDSTTGKNMKLKYCGIALAFVLAGILLDQGTKYLVVTYLKDADPVVLIPGVLQLEYLENRGAAFGLFQNMQMVFMVFSLVISALVIFFYWHLPTEKPKESTRSFFPLRICLVMLLAGALGNCIDRLRLDYVVDFIYIKLINFPIFNVADMFVTIAVALLIVLLLFYYKEADLDLMFGKEKDRDHVHIHD